MNYIAAEGLAKSYAEKILFKDLNISINKNEKIALIANNGTGKTSLLRFLAGKDTADAGKVIIRNGLRIGFLEQEPVLDEKLTIQELINGAHSGILSVIRSYEDAMHAQSESYNDKTQEAFDIAAAKMDEYDAWDYERRFKMVLNTFNIYNLEQKISSLSGGQRKRLALALVLLDNPEILILDEPTNHLDIEMIEWLEKLLLQNTITLLMVTHDRYFLDRVCNNIFELSDGKLYRHKGNYAQFLENRTKREEIFQTEIAKAGKEMKKELEWMRKMPKARTTKSKSRIDNFYAIQDKANSGKTEQELKLEVKMSRIGGKILELKKVNKNYGDLKILDGFDYTFKKGERIGIIGKNGVGKSTFLNIITGSEKPDSGKVNTGETIVYGYYSQAGMKFKEEKRVIEILKDIAEVITLADGSKLSASQFLEQFMFPPEVQYNFVSKLSGGEKKRLYLLTVLIKNPNFLILDEPTNDLDLLTLNKLEEFMINFPGCVIVVSHDRYFMDKMVDHLFVFEGNGVINDYNGTYTEYRLEKEELQRESKTVKVETNVVNHKSSGESSKKKKISYKEKLEYEQLEREIELLENEKKEVEAALHSIANKTNYEELEKLSSRFGELSNIIDEKTLRWMELGENS